MVTKETANFHSEIELSGRLLTEKLESGVVGIDSELGEKGLEALIDIIPEIQNRSVHFGGNFSRKKCFTALNILNSGNNIMIPVLAKQKKFSRIEDDDLSPYFERCYRGLISVRQEIQMCHVSQKVLVGFKPEVLVERPLGFFIEKQDKKVKSECSNRWVVFERLDFKKTKMEIPVRRDIPVDEIRDWLEERGVQTHELCRDSVYWLKDGRIGLFDMEGYALKKDKMIE